jgi:hypothetical protein
MTNPLISTGPVEASGPVTANGPIQLPKSVISPAGTQQQATDPSLPANTTFQNDLMVAGQRRINLIWESTQACVTVLLTVAAIYCAVKGIDADILNFGFVAIISTYYARTNHTKIGGVTPDTVGR